MQAQRSRSERVFLFWRRLAACVMGSVVLLSLLAACGSGAGALGGGDWQQSSLRQPEIRALVAQPDDPNTLYAGNSQGQIFYSTDGGSKWSATSPEVLQGSAIQALTFDSAGKKLYAATGHGLFVSSAPTQQWQTLVNASTHLPSTSYTTIAVDEVRSNHLYAGTADQGVFISSDNGTTWRQANSGLPGHVAIKQLVYDPATHRLWAVTAGGLYRSDDRGETWQAVSTSLPATTELNVVMPASVGGGRQGLIYLGTSKGTFLSQDNGLHWISGKSPLPGLQIYSILVDFRQQANTVPVYVGSSIGPLRSDDEGQSWRSIASGWPRKVPAYTMILGASDYARLYAAGRDALYQYPGTSTGFSADRLLPFVIVIVFFGLLYWLLQRGRRRGLRTRESERESGAAQKD